MAECDRAGSTHRSSHKFAAALDLWKAKQIAERSSTRVMGLLANRADATNTDLRHGRCKVVERFRRRVPGWSRRAGCSDLAQPRMRMSPRTLSSPVPNSSIARHSVIGLVQSRRYPDQPRGYISVATEGGASGLVAEKAGQSVWCFTLRVRLRAFVTDQKFGDGARDVVHPTDLERGDRKAHRWSDASMRDENSHAGVKSKAQATNVRAFDPIPRLRKPTDAENV